MEQLNNKVVLITGFSGGLGTFVTDAFLEAGARVTGVAANHSGFRSSSGTILRDGGGTFEW